MSLSYLFSCIYTNYQKQTDLSLRDVKELPKIKTLIMGDSMGLRGLDPVVFDSAFNYASSGENVILSYYKLKNLLQTRNDIETIILTSNLGYFGQHKANYFRRLNVWQSMIDFKELAEIKQQRSLYLYKLFKATFFAYKGMREDYFERRFDNIEEELPYYRGFKPKPFGYKFDILKTADKQFKGQKPFDKSSWIYLKMLLSLAKEHNISVYMVRLPFTKRYHDRVLSHVKQDRLPNMSLELQKDFPDFVFLDYLHVFEGQDDQVFFDDTHLNQQGASILSRLVYKEMLRG